MKSMRNISIALSAVLILLLAPACSSFFNGGPGQNTLDSIDGEWVRVASNNPANDGMVVTVTGSTGTVTENPRSSFAIGAVKWRNVTPNDASGFNYEELGSDANYYDATMELDGDTIFIDVFSTGAGNIQKYVKRSEYTDPGPSAETITLDCSGFNTDSELENGPAAVDYIVPSGCVLDVTAALSIQAGTVIQFEENSGIGVYDGGSLKMVGTSAEPIILRGKEAIAGYWRGIHIETNSFNNLFDYVNISDAGSNYVYCCNTVATVFLKGGKLKMTNSTLSNGDGYGLYANEQAELLDYANNEITTHTDMAMWIHLERAGELDGTGSTYVGNEKDFVGVFESTLDEEVSVPALDVPFFFEEGKVMDIIDDLTLEAGVEIVMGNEAGIGVIDNGSLKVTGTNTAPVTIRGEEATQGYWRGIHMETNSINNQISYLTVSDAGSDYVYCCNTTASIFLKDGRASFENTTLSNGAGYGFATKADFEFTNFSENQVTTHAEEPLYLSLAQASAIDGLSSNFAGNDRDVILLYRASLDGEGITLKKTNVPYGIETNVVIDIKQPLTLNPGVIMEFRENAGLGVYDSGTLNAEGTASEKIIFRGASDEVGYWRGIHTETNSSNNVLDHVDISNAGSNYVYCCNQKAGLFVKAGQMTVSNSYIHDNGGCGIAVGSSGTLTESGNTFANNTEGHICN